MRHIKISSLSKDETLAFKALGIILIVFHNYFRWVEPITGENEFYFSRGNITSSIDVLSSNLLELINVFFNYLGHYGVQVFIFVSAYGLTKAYQNNSFSYRGFVGKRFAKLYPTMLIAAFAMVIFNVIAHGNLPTKGNLVEIGVQLSLLSTFLPNKALVAVGPWWFYSFIFQFYLLFPLLLKLYKKYRDIALILIAIAGYVIVIFLNPVLLNYKINLMQTVFGHLPEFCLGIWFVNRNEYRINVWFYISIWIIFLLGSYYREFWYFSHLTVIIVLFPILQGLVKNLSRFSLIHKFLSFIGIVSVYIFATHGYLRWDCVNLANSLNHPIAEFLIGIMFFLFSMGFSWMLLSADGQIRKWVNNTSIKVNRTWRIIIVIGVLGGLAVSVKACQSINWSRSKKKEQTSQNLNSTYFTSINNLQKEGGCAV